MSDPSDREPPSARSPFAPPSWPVTVALLAVWLVMVVALGSMLGLLAALVGVRGGLDGFFQALGMIAIGFWGSLAAGVVGAALYCGAGRPRETGVKALAATAGLDALALVALLIAQAVRG